VASDGALACEASSTACVTCAYPVVTPASEDIHYDVGSTGNALAWVVVDPNAPNPSYAVFRVAGTTGQPYASYSFEQVGTASSGLPAAAGCVTGWSASSLARVRLQSDWMGMPEALLVDASGEYPAAGHVDEDAQVSFVPMSAGTIEWYAWENPGLFSNGGNILVEDAQGPLLDIANGGVYGYGVAPYLYGATAAADWPNNLGWIPLTSGWVRFLFTFDSYSGRFSLTACVPGYNTYEPWNTGDAQYGGLADNFTWAGSLGRAVSQGISAIDFRVGIDRYGEQSQLCVGDRFGFSTDPFYRPGALANPAPVFTQVAAGLGSSSPQGYVVSCPAGGLPVGEYDYVMVAQDGAGLAASQWAHVSVWGTPPAINRAAPLGSVVDFQEGTWAPPATWLVADSYCSALQYTVTCDGVQATSGTAAPGACIQFPVSPLKYGNHAVTLSVADPWGQVAADTVEVAVSSETPAVSCTLVGGATAGGVYPGTWTFDSSDRNPFPDGWSVGYQDPATGQFLPDTSGQYTRVFSGTVGGHAGVLEMTKNSGDQMALALYNVGATTSPAGFVECWLDVSGDPGVAGGLVLIFGGSQGTSGMGVAGVNITVDGTGRIIAANNLNQIETLSNQPLSPGWHHWHVAYSMDGTASGSYFTVTVDGGTPGEFQSNQIPLGGAATTLQDVGFMLGAPTGSGAETASGAMYADAVGVSWDPTYAAGMDLAGGQQAGEWPAPEPSYDATYTFDAAGMLHVEQEWSLAAESSPADFGTATNVMGHANALVMCPVTPAPAEALLNLSSTPQDSGTVEMWFELGGSPADSYFHVVLGHWALDAASPAGDEVPDYVVGVDNGSFSCSAEAGGTSSVFLGPAVAYGTWHHIRIDWAISGVTYSGGKPDSISGEIRVYLDDHNATSDQPIYEAPFDIPGGVSLVGIAAGAADGSPGTTALADAMGCSWDSAYNLGEDLVPQQSLPAPEVSIENGAPGQNLQWVATDPDLGGTQSSGTYTLYADGAAVPGIIGVPWASGATVSYGLSGLAAGDHVFTVVFDDGLGASTTSTVTVHVLAHPPAITVPANISLQFTPQPIVLQWSISDMYFSGTSSFALWQVGGSSPVLAGPWSAGELDTSVGLLQPGAYQFYLVADDGYGGDTTSGTCAVTISDIAPTASSLGSVAFDAGQAGQAAAWVVTSVVAANGSYAITLNGAQVASGTWQNGTQVLLDLSALHLPAGSYSLALNASDGYGGATTAACAVTVDALPVVSLPGSASYEVGTPSFNLTWSVSGATFAGNQLAVFVDGTLLASAPTSWSPGVPGAVALSGLLPSLYNVTLVATDAHGGVGQGTCWVAVLDTPPAISAPANVTYAFGTPNANITWTVTANHPTKHPTYVLFRNGTQVGAGTWASGVPFNASVSGLAVGAYNFTLDASDGYGASAADSVFVYVTQPNVMAMVQSELAYLNATSSSCWKNKDACLKAAILEVLQRVERKLAAGNYAGAYDLLNKTVVPDLQAWVVNATLKVQCSQWAAATLNAICAQIPTSLVAVQLEAVIAQLATAVLLAENASLGGLGKVVVADLQATQAASNASLATYLAASASKAQDFARAAKDYVLAADCITDTFHGHTSADKAWEALDAALDSEATVLSSILGIFAVY
jgi:hypothetical protein